MPSSVTLVAVSVVTQGAPNLDFTGVRAEPRALTGVLPRLYGASKFLPKAAGTRLGGVVLSDQSGDTLLAVRLSGTGTGPMVVTGGMWVRSARSVGTLQQCDPMLVVVLFCPEPPF